VKTARVVIVGGGFAGLSAAKTFAHKPNVQVTLIDRRNYHLFQPLLYQVATAGLSPAEIAYPLRSILSGITNIDIVMGEVKEINQTDKIIKTESNNYEYDYLIMACGATQSYFGNDQWEGNAPSLKTLEQATEIRRRMYLSFELAEKEANVDLRKKYLTFVIVGGGPTGVELAGAIGEITRFTLSNDFHHINPKHTRIILVEAGSRILPSFSPELSSQSMRDLEALGVQVWTDSKVTNISEDGIQIGKEFIEANTVVWAAGVGANPLNKTISSNLDRGGRVIVEPDLSLKENPNIFIIGDQAHLKYGVDQTPLPGLAPVAMQQGRYVARLILNELKDKPRKRFFYVDKGQMATIGKSKAVAMFRGFEFKGFTAWVGWLIVHIYYLIGFKNRMFVLIQWSWTYWTFRRGARLIVNKDWKSKKD